MPAPDPAVALAHSLATRPNVYAVLLGSGVSRPAGIPTGWDVVDHLLARLAAMVGAAVPGDLGDWYEAAYAEPATYSGVVTALGLSAGDRRALIADLIDPGGRRRGPTSAHRAVAGLAANGHISVVLTTNFDPLMERALDELGVNHVVLATTDAVDHALPLHHYGVPVVVKLHRDWHDERMLNTVAELAVYDPPIDRLLDRVLDDHGLVIAGWSATWDPALRAAFLRARHRDHAATYWLEPYTITAEAQQVIDARDAVIITTTADDFLGDVAAKVEAVTATAAAVHPLDTATAVAQIKVRLADPTRAIEVRDQVMAEARRLAAAISDPATNPVSGVATTDELMLARAARYEASTRTLALLLANGCTFGPPTLDPVWSQSLELVANPPGEWGGSTALLYLRGYPALVALYAAGVAAVAADNYTALAAMWLHAEWRHPNERVPLVLGINPDRVLATGGEAPHWLHPGSTRFYAPASKHLEAFARGLTEELIPSAERFEDTFDRFEALLGLVHMHLASGAVLGGPDTGWGPVGQFAHRYRYLRAPLIADLASELNSQGAAWPPVAAGLFGTAHAFDMAVQACRRFGELVAGIARH